MVNQFSLFLHRAHHRRWSISCLRTPYSPNLASEEELMAIF